MQKEMYAQAIDAYQKTLAIDPNLPDTHCSLGNLLKHTGERAAAKQCYTNAIRLRPDYAVAWNNLAGACKDDGDLHNAIACYREVRRRDGEEGMREWEETELGAGAEGEEEEGEGG